MYCKTITLNSLKPLAIMFALVFSTNAASATDLFERHSMKDEETTPTGHGVTVSGSATFTSQYITDGLRETDGSPTVQASIELGYKQFYLGIWGSGLDYPDNSADVEIDVYGGVKFNIDRFLVDVGFIYYAYPDADDDAGEYDFIEGKLGISTDLTDNVNVGAAIFYTPEIFGEGGEVWSYEGNISIALGKYDRFSPTFSAKVGHLDFADNSAASYTYWNAGVEIGIGDKLSLDLRYWDTDIDNNQTFADADFVASITASF